MAFAFKDSAIAPAARIGLPDLQRAGVGRAPRCRSSHSARIIMVLALVLGDVVAVQLAFFLGAELYSSLAGNTAGGFGFNLHLAVVALLLPIGYILLDVYRVCDQAPIERFPLRIKTTCLLFVLLVGWHYATQYLLWPAAAAALTFAFAVVLPLLGESIVRSVLIRRGLWGVPTVVIGAGATGRQVVRVLQQMPELGLRPVGFFDDHHADDQLALTLIEGLPVLGSIADAAKYSQGIETAIVTAPA